MFDPSHRPRQPWSARVGPRVQLLGAAVLFGLTAAVVRLASGSPGGLTGAQTSAIRFCVGTAFSVLLFRLRPGTLRAVNRPMLVTRGALGGLAALLYFMALARIPAGRATLLNCLFPLMATVLALVALRERPTVRLMVAITITSFGVFLVLGGGSLHLALGWGELAAVGSAVLAAGAITSIRVLRATDNAPTIFFAFCLGGMAMSVPLAGGPIPTTPTVWLLALLAALLSMGAQLLMTQAYGAVTVAEAAVWQQLTPIASFASAAVILGESVTASGALGVLLGVVGVVYATLSAVTHNGPNGCLPRR
ncbi:DMT family transporter [Myxococcota bacterium]